MLDQELLADGQLAVSRASGIFPDGLLFDIPGSDQPPPSKALAEFFDPGVRDLDIYLTVPDYRQKGLNVSRRGPRGGLSLSGGDHHRASTKIPGREKSRFRLRARICACWPANETREGSSALRIANVRTHRSRRLPTEYALRSAAARSARQRLSARPGQRAAGNSLRKKHATGRRPPAEKPEPGRLHRLRHRQLLAAVHRQFAHPRAQPPAAGAALPSGGVVLRAHRAGRFADHFFYDYPAARPSALRPSESQQGLYRSG